MVRFRFRFRVRFRVRVWVMVRFSVRVRFRVRVWPLRYDRFDTNPVFLTGDQGAMVSSTVLYRTVPYRTVPYRTVPYPSLPYRTGDQGAMAIARALELNHTLQSLNLRFNNIGSAGVRV